MIAIHPKYITDTAGEKWVTLPLHEFDNLMEELEGLEDICLFDEAKKEEKGTRILLTDYLKNRKGKNA